MAISCRQQVVICVALFLLAAALWPASCWASGPDRSSVPGYPQAVPYYNLANRYLQQGRYEEAIANYQLAIGKYPNEADFYVNLGVAYRKLDDYVNAEAAFKKAISLNDKDWASWSNLANAYLKQDRLEDTVKAFEQTLKCNPPETEREAILKDIADIKRILSLRQPQPVEKQTASGPDGRPPLASEQRRAGKAQTLPDKAPFKPRPGSAQSPKRSNEAPDPASLKRSGWDWLYR